MIREVHEKVFTETLATGDIEKAYVLNVYGESVTLISDLEISEDTFRIEKMSFALGRSKIFPLDIEAKIARKYYSGGITIDSYDDENEAIRDFLNAYKGLYFRHYIISSDVTIEEIRRLKDGILYIYIEEE